MFEILVSSKLPIVEQPVEIVGANLHATIAKFENGITALDYEAIPGHLICKR